MYAATVPPLLRSLGALSHLLNKAEAHCTAHGIDPSILLTDRLFPNMLPMSRQVQLACDFAARMGARLAGAEVPSFPDVETTLPELQTRIVRVCDYLKSLNAADFDTAATREIVIKIRDLTMPFTGQSYHSSYALPQFYFHMTTAYNILRKNGVEIGKRDFMGA